MIIYVDKLVANDLLLRTSGLLIWSQTDDYKKFFDYLSTSHYYNARCTFNFINQVKRR